MNATATHANFERMFSLNEDEHTGASLVGKVLGITAQVTSLILAFSTGSFWLGMLVWFVSSFLLGLLAAIAAIYFCVNHADKVESFGRMANAASSKVRGWFGR